MNRVSYPFGETPREVIRERHRALMEDVLAERLRPFELRESAWVFYAPTDTLLTMLDALTKGATYSGSVDPESPSGKLRIDILASIGIDEGGES